MTPQAILFGEDEMLNLTRRWILERTGCVVYVATRSEDVVRLCTEYAISLLVLCHTLPKRECELGIVAAEALRPGVKKVWLCPRWQIEPPNLPEDVVLSGDRPHELFVVLRQVVDALAVDAAGR